VDFVNRAIISIVKNIGKATLLLLAIFALGCVMAGAISVQGAIQDVNASMRSQLLPIVTIDFDQDALQEYHSSTGRFPEYDSLDLDILLEIADLPYVRNHDFSFGSDFLVSDLERYYANEKDRIPGTLSGGLDRGNLTLTGVQSVNPIILEEKVIEISSGRMFTEDEVSSLSYVALISEEFATLNNLQIGSTFPLRNVVWDTRGHPAPEDYFFHDEENVYVQRSYSFEVVGFFRFLTEIDTGNEWEDRWVKDTFLNSIYVPNPVAAAAWMYQTEHKKYLFPDATWLPENLEIAASENVGNIFALDSSCYVENFRVAAEEILPDYWVVIDSNDALADVVTSIGFLADIANVVLWLAVGASILILGLLITLVTHERKREFGIYLSMGEKRSKIIFQMLVEVLAVSVIALTSALLVGNIFAVNISEVMLQNDLAARQAVSDQWWISASLDTLGFATSVYPEQFLTGYNASLNATMIVIFYAVGIATIFVATIVPMLYIMRLNPRKIML